MDLDKAKIKSLEAELARMPGEAKKYYEALAAKDTTMATIESWRQKVSETLMATEHQFFQMH